MVLYIAGIGAVYVATNFVVASSASKSDQGAAASIFNVALQVGGSVLGLAVLTAIAEGIQRTYGGPEVPSASLGDVGFRSVYYSCVILCGIGFFLSVFAIKVPDSMRGSIWGKQAAPIPVTDSAIALAISATSSSTRTLKGWRYIKAEPSRLSREYVVIQKRMLRLENEELLHRKA